MPNLRDIKAGDTVFVVHQNQRRKSERCTETVSVSRVGLKYGYVAVGYHGECPFDRKTGESHHKEWYSRANGFGFDVYHNEQEYQREQRAIERHAELSKRLVGRNGRLIDLSPEAVIRIDDVLDEYGVPKV